MRRETLLGVGFLLAAIAEIQWATTFLGMAGMKDGPIAAFLTFAAGAGLLLVAFGYLIATGAAWTRLLGLGAAALAHIAYFAVTVDWALPVVLAAALAALGLATAAWGTRAHQPGLVRVGLVGGALAGLVWTMSDLLQGDASFMVGNVFATVGFGLAAWSTEVPPHGAPANGPP